MFEKTVAALKGVEEAIAEEVQAVTWHSKAGVLQDLQPAIVNARQTLEATDQVVSPAPEPEAPAEEPAAPAEEPAEAPAEEPTLGPAVEETANA